MPLNSFAQQITDGCTGNYSESCFIYIHGEIKENTGSRLRQYPITDGNRVVLNSPGGSLLGGIILGAVIRDLGLTTEVGYVTTQNGGREILRDKAYCLSACAYAFLGGLERDVNSVSRLGFHRFYNPIDFIDNSLDSAGLMRSISSEDTQKISSLLVLYIVQMGIDARMLIHFQHYGADSVYVFNETDAIKYGIVTNRRFSEWFIEPYRQSIIAASEKLGTSGPYDQVAQVTTYCRLNGKQKKSYLLMSVPLQDYSDPKETIRNGAILRYGTGSTDYVEINSEVIKGWKDKSFMQIEIALSEYESSIFTQGKYVNISLNAPRVIGGFKYETDLSLRDRKFIEASFFHCR